jgi:plastocyanin
VALVVPTVAAVAVILTFALTTSPRHSPGNGAQIEIENYTFNPALLRVKAGTTIRITNADPTSHTVTADGHSFTTSTLASGAQATITVDVPGIYHYHCNFHSFMHGVIEVSARGTPNHGGKR